MIGFFNILKPTGISSGAVVNAIKRRTKQKVGHLGTLDPAASGVLTIAIGKATRFFDYFLGKDKEYVALGKFGVETDTLDGEGTVLSRDDKQVSLEQINKILPVQIGEIEQMPPLYSAKNVNGIRAYDAARKGIDIKLSAKKVHIFDIKAQKTTISNLFRFKIHCSSGTYVRSIVRDIAYALGTKATTVVIIRTRSGPFDISSSNLLEEVLDQPQKCLLKVNDILKFDEYNLSQSEANDLASGKHIKVDLKDGRFLAFKDSKEFCVLLVKSGEAESEIYLYEGE